MTEKLIDPQAAVDFMIAKSAEYARITAKMNAGAIDTFLTSLDKGHDMILAKIAAEGLPVPVLMLWDYNDKSAPVRWAP